MPNILIFPSPKHSELASEANIQAARDQLVELLANLVTLNSELSLLLQEENSRAVSPVSCEPAAMPGEASRGNSSVGTG